MPMPVMIISHAGWRTTYEKSDTIWKYAVRFRMPQKLMSSIAGLIEEVPQTEKLTMAVSISSSIGHCAQTAIIRFFCGVTCVCFR